MQRVSSYQQLEALLQPPVVVRSTLTNDFNLKDSYQRYIDDGLLYCTTKDSNLFLLVNKGDFFQAYYHLNNNTGLDLPEHQPIVVEIPYRKHPNRPVEQISNLRALGFVDHIERHLYTAYLPEDSIIDAPSVDVEIKVIERATHASYIHTLIENTFDRYTGDILREEEVAASINNGEVFGVFENGTPVACLEYYLKGKVAWIGHIVVDPDRRGLGYGKQLVKFYLKTLFESGIRRYQHWVVADNNKAVNMYTKLGFVYGNKSSFSMLRPIPGE